jgi:hypothetical protein
MIRKYLAITFLGALSLSFSGCVHQEVAGKPEPASRTMLTVTRSGDSVRLGWKSEVEKVYDILYTEKLGGQTKWKILPGANNLRGTGKIMTFTDAVENGMTRYYRLNISISSPRKIPR